MIRTEHSAKASHSIGRFVVLRGLLRSHGSGVPSPARRLTLTGLVFVCALASALAVGATAALATRGRVVSIHFGSPGSAAGEMELAYDGQLSDQSSKSGVAVNDETHDVYVADTDNHRVDVFNDKGLFQFAFGKEVESLGGDVCTLMTGCQKGAVGTEPGALQAPSFIAVDNSSGPSHGDVYVGASVGSVAKNEVRVIHSNATGGTYTLTFEGETTEPIPYAEPSEMAWKAIQIALEKLPKIGNGNIGVTQKTVPGGTDIEFLGALAEKMVPPLTVDASGLSPAGSTLETIIVQEGSPFVQETISKFTAEGTLVDSWGNNGPGESANGQLAGSSKATGTGDFTAGTPAAGTGELVGGGGSTTITNVVTSTGAFAVGQVIQALGIHTSDLPAFPSGTVITAVGAETLTVSKPCKIFCVEADKLVTDSVLTNVVTSTGVFGIGQRISGTGIEGTIEAVGPETLAVSANPTASGTGVALTAAPNPLESPPEGIAVDMAGDLWSEGGQGAMEVMDEFTQEGKFIQNWSYSDTSRSSHAKGGIATDSAGNIYGVSGNNFIREEGAVEKFTPAGVDLGVVSPGKGPGMTTGLAVDQASNDLYVDRGASIEEISPSGGVLNTFGPPELKAGAGLAVDSSIETVYVADSAADTLDGFVPSPPSAPTVEPGSESVSEVTADSATFGGGEVNPRSLSNEPDTEYFFEYTTEAQFQREGFTGATRTPSGSLPASFDVDTVAPVHVQGLSADAVYHYRLVAENKISRKEGKLVAGEDGTLTTQRSGAAFSLPDGRSWELVTPAQKHGALFYGQNYGWTEGVEPNPFVAKASANGDAMINLASAPTEEEPQGYAENTSVLSTHGSAGWSSQVIAPPHDEATGPAAIGQGGEYTLFSEDLSLGILQPLGNFMALSPEASEATAYLRTDYLGGNVSEHCQTSCYRPLVTAANTSPGKVFGEEKEGLCEHLACGPLFIDATPDLSHVILGPGYTTPVQLTSTPDEGDLYEWSDGQLQPLYLLPKHEGGVGVNAGELSSVTHQLSDEGSVFFSHSGRLYVHDFAKDESYRLDVAQGVAEPTEADAGFLYASSDGSKVLFSDSEQLTTAPGGGIYECRIVEAAGSIKCELELTGLAGGGLIGGSEDASYLYFLGAGGKLVVDHYNGREWMTTNGPFVGTQKFPEAAPPPGTLGNFRVSPNGLYFTFMSNEDLAGYDTRDAISGKPDLEVYLYDAASNGLICTSCNPTGARPVGDPIGEPENKDYSDELVAGSFGTENNDSSVAANLPPWTNSHTTGSEWARYQPRFLSDSGRLFFDSYDALVPDDVNGAQDVYEWEPAGVGTCTEATASGSAEYVPGSHGCVGLISSGTSAEESAFMDASETGGDVFFITQSKLVPEDTDDALDVYDAHECTSALPCVAPAVQSPPCDTEASCKAAPMHQPEIYGAPASATFSGIGNISPPSSPPPAVKKVTTKTVKCKKGFVKNKHNKCVRKKTPSKKAKKASDDRRTK